MTSSFSISRLPGFRRAAPISGMQVAAARLVVGLYLVGMGVVLWRLGSPATPAPWTLVIGLPLLGLALVAGRWRPLFAVLSWVLWSLATVWLLQAQDQGVSAWLPRIGLLLIYLALIPPGEGLVLGARLVPDRDWRFPANLYLLGWLLLAIAAAFNAWLSFTTPMWRDGQALEQILAAQGEDRGVVATWMLQPGRVQMLTTLTFATMGLQALVLPLSVHRAGRFIAWFFLLVLALGALLLGIGVDRGVGLLVVLIVLFDPQWVKPGVAPAGPKLVLFDGVCGLCNRFVSLLIQDDHGADLTFAPLQSDTGQAALKRHQLPDDLDSIVYLRGQGTEHETVHVKSDAILYILSDVGGFHRLAGVFRILPLGLRNWCYDRLAASRYRIFGKYDACPLPDPADAARFVDS